MYIFHSKILFDLFTILSIIDHLIMINFQIYLTDIKNIQNHLLLRIFEISFIIPIFLS